MKQRSIISSFLKTLTLIPLIMILAIISHILTVIKQAKEYDKIKKRRIEILIKKNPMFLNNINKIVKSLDDALNKAYPDISKYIKKRTIYNEDIKLDFEDDYVSDFIKIEIIIFDILNKDILKSVTGYSDINKYKESIGKFDKSLSDINDYKEIEEIKNIINEIKNAIKLVNECAKEQYKGCISLISEIDFFELDEMFYGDLYICLKINGNINKMDLPKEFKEKVKNIATKIKINNTI